jgi:hypothetical protein
MQFIKKLFWADDRTGLVSTTKLLRWLTWIMAFQFIIVCEFLIISKMIVLSMEELQVIGHIKEFLIFFCGFSESSYQYNRASKMKLGTVPPLEAEVSSNKKEVQEFVREEI